MKDFVNKLIKDVAVDLNDEFDLNFQNRTFFDRPWPTETFPTKIGNSLLNNNGHLRRSIQNPIIGEDSITWTSSLPYASIQNEGGEITVTAKMKKFFWAMYYKSSGAITKGGKVSGSKRNQNLSIEAQQWKNLALMKTGSKIKIPQRQFIGDHPRVQERIQVIFDKNMKEIEAYFNEQFKQK